jgi:hypothetical protein
VREFPVEGGFADYMLFVDRKAVGVVEAKKVGTTLSGVAEQAGSYAAGLPQNVPHVGTDKLPFVYESTGVETFFRDERDPEPRSRYPQAGEAELRRGRAQRRRSPKVSTANQPNSVAVYIEEGILWVGGYHCRLSSHDSLHVLTCHTCVRLIVLQQSVQLLHFIIQPTFDLLIIWVLV